VRTTANVFVMHHGECIVLRQYGWPKATLIK